MSNKISTAFDIANTILRLRTHDLMDVFAQWEQIVDEQTSRLAKPYKITGGDNKILILEVQKGFALQILHESTCILRQINDFLGRPAFSQLKVIQMDF